MNVASASTENRPPALTIATHKISKRYNREWVFRNLTYRFEPGLLYAITGPNGSGKSTLLQVLWGQVPQTSGTLRYLQGEAEVPPDAIYKYISIATPYMDLIEEYTLREMLEFHFRLKKLRPGISLQDLVEIMYLSDALDKQLVNFSSGMKQRVKLAIAFHTVADVYFLDEPGTNLDDRAFQWYLTQLVSRPPSATVIVASNNPKEYPDAANCLNLSDLKQETHRA